MANVKITALTGISSADVANEDVFVVVDLSEDETKKITLANIIAAVDTTQLSNVVALQGGLTGSNVRITSEEANVLALQGGLIGANSNQVAIATFADDTGIWQAGNLFPKANGVYSLGWNNALWKDIYMTGGTIFLGNVSISEEGEEGIKITGASGQTATLVTPEAGGAANVSANIALLESNITILLGSSAGQNTRIAAEEANVINLQTGLVGANVALTNEIAATNVDVTNLVTGIGGSNSRIAAEEANVIALQSGISGSNSRIAAEEANVIALQAGLTGANTAISSNDTDITNLVTGLDGANTDVTALEARRAANTSIFLGAFSGSNTRLAAEEANVIALQGGIAGANSAISSNDTDITNLITGLDGANTVIATKAATTYVDAQIAAIVDSAPETLDTLNELAAALGDDANFATTTATQIGTISSNTVNLQTGIAGSNTNITATETRRAANTSIFLGAFTGSNARIAAEEANVIALQGGIAGANTALANEIAETNTDITNLVTGLDGANTNVTALEARRAANTSIFLGAFTGSNTRIAAEEANVIALQGGIAGANTALSNEIAATNTDITNLVTGLEGSNTTIATKDSVANVYATYLVAKGGIDGANTAISSNDTDITNLVTGLEGANTDVTALEARRDANTSIFLGAFTGANTRIAAEEANVIALQAGLTGANTNISSNDTDITNLVTGLGGSNTNITALESRRAANTAILLGAHSGANTRIAAEEANVIALQGGITGANSAIASNDTDITNLVTGLEGSNTNITALEARRAANTAILLGAHSGANTRIAAEEANVIALQGGIAGANTAIGLRATTASPTFTGVPAAPTAAAGTSTTQIATTAFVGTAVANIVDSAPEALNTLNELAAALGDDANFSTTISTQIGTISSNTVTNATNITAVEARRTANIAGAVSSITTSDLTASRALTSDGSGKVAVSDVTATELGYLDGVTSAIQTQLDAKLEGNQTITLSGDVSGSGTTSITVTVADDSHNHVISNIDNLQTSLDAKDTVANVYATYLVAKGGIDGANAAISSNDTDITNLVTGLGGANTNITAVEARRTANIAGAVSSITTGNLTASRALVSDGSGKVAVSAVTSTELGYLDGVTSAIQTQLDGKQASGSYLTGNQTITLSGDVSGSGTTAITVTVADDSHNHVISNIDNLQTTLDAKDTVANVYATYLVAKGGINGANTNITAVEARRTANIAGAVSSITTGNLTASRALVSDGSGKVAVSAVTSTELGYLDGVTSAIQTQLDAKLASSSYTAADVLSKLLTVDGSGSGLDADTLDGVQGTSFLRSDADDATTGTLTVGGNLLPATDNTGVVGNSTYTWNNGQFTNLTVDSTLSVRSYIDLADSDGIRFGSSDDARYFYNGTTNELNIEMEAACLAFIWTDNTTELVRLTKSTGDFNLTTGKWQEGGNDLIPAGFIGMWGAAAAPSGWYLCEGGAISRTTYADLFAAIGTTYGAGDGSTTFNVPDFRDRAPYGASTYTLGSKTGTEINGSAQVATASGGPTTHTVTTSTTNSTTDKDVTNSITVVTAVSAHSTHTHTVTYPATAVKFIIKT